MPCYRPRTAYAFNGLVHAKTGKRKLFFGAKAARILEARPQDHEVFTIPCGRCVGCKGRKAQDWSLRIMHEASFFEDTSFLTLTYDREHLPEGRTLVKKHFQDFMKRLRIDLERKHERRIRYFAVGEYGELRGRPHYHAIVFGYSFPDRVPVGNNPGAVHQLYTSEFLRERWSHGDVKIGDLTEDSAKYVAQYSLKKVGGREAEREYAHTGRIPPFILVSKGLGRRWYARFHSDCYPSDFLVEVGSGRRVPVPRFYDKLFAERDPEGAARLKADREERVRASLNPADVTPERLREREEVKCAQLRAMRGKYEAEADRSS